MKLSSIPTGALITVCVFAFVIHQHHCFEINAFGYLKNKLFGHAEDTSLPEDFQRSNDFHDGREHGSLDSIGRDIVRGTSRAYRKIKQKIQRAFSSETKGLDCNKTLSGGGVESFKSRIRIIFPGTKWCGDGNISSSYDDLGRYSVTDSCCREHDLCPDNMAADETKYGLVNTGLFTRSRCDCDRRFYECLKEASNVVANSIGYTYFTILGPQCFEQDYPVVDCLQEKGGKCEVYLKDRDGEKEYQWFDSPIF